MLINDRCRNKTKQTYLIVDFEMKNKDYGDFIGDYVSLYDEKKENVAKIIQRNWRQCRYNPKYKMCEKIQYSGLVEICNDTI